ncbi:MAG TPA: UDP-glucose/GDP-mannose dehydrogenase family protein [Candidatus Thermoplasmatota archaeon]|nr:UDP-glucose/GDP-mannose dehydrogenase family protein [Candidatus Thermoplasmatota archaeon]
MNITVIGTGYVGLVSGACFAKLGHTVTCVDIDEEKVRKINNGIAPIFEEGLEEILATNKDRIKATTDHRSAVMDSDVTFICVGTPSRKDGSIDLSFIKETVIQIAKILKEMNHWHLIVVKSTVLPGTTQNTVLPLLEQHSGKHVGSDLGLAMNPEFLKEGVAIPDFLNPDRIVIGSADEKSTATLKELYNSLTCPILVTSLSAAEMIKYASNTFLATKISFINEIGNLCKHLKIDTYQVAEGMGLDRRIGRPFLDSGIGWGGSCFPKDVDALLAWAHEIKEDAHITESTRDVNNDQPLRLIRILKKHLPKLKGKTIGILGLAFKPNTDDIRESRTIPIVQALLKEGAHVKAYDPQAMPSFKKLFPQLTYCATAQEVLSSDAILITTLWKEFTMLDYRGRTVIDGRRLEHAKNAQIYEGVCW